MRCKLFQAAGHRSVVSIDLSTWINYWACAPNANAKMLEGGDGRLFAVIPVNRSGEWRPIPLATPSSRAATSRKSSNNRVIPPTCHKEVALLLIAPKPRRRWITSTPPVHFSSSVSIFTPATLPTPVGQMLSNPQYFAQGAS
jgi:hypothetical protein